MASKIGVIILLVGAVAVSGCIDSQTTPAAPDSSTNDTGEQSEPTEPVDWAACENIQLRIDQVSDPAMIRQMNEKPIGEVSVNWRFENGETVTERVNLSRKGQLRFIESGVSGSIQDFEATSSRCPDRSFSSE